MRTSDTAFRHVSGWLPGTALLLALLLTGCGEPGSPFGDDGTETRGTDTNGTDDPEPNPDPDPDPDPDPEPEPEPEPEPVEYVWGLPPSDTSVGETHQGAEGSAYIALSSSCEEGAEFLSPDLAPTYNFESPRNVLLFAAGLRLCEGDPDGARPFFGQAEAHGTAGLQPDDWAFCVLYKVVRSVLDQRPPDDFSCEGGDAPPFKIVQPESGEPLTDDPLTLDVDESVSPAPDPDPDPAPDPEPDPDPDPDPEPDPDPDLDGETEGENDVDPDGDEGSDTETQSVS